METEKILLAAPRGVPAKMVSEYVNRCLASLPVARKALDQSDYGHMRVFGHRLSGTGGAYGIPALSQAGAGIEEAARRGDTTELGARVAALEAYLSRIEILPG